MKTAWIGFQGPVASHIGQYLATKRALGCRFNNEDRTLRLLDRFLVDQRVTSMETIMPEHIDQFLASRPRHAPRGYNHLLNVVRRLFDWLVSQQVIAVSPVQARPRPETARRLPFLVDAPLARRLLEVASHLPDNNRCRYRGPTYHVIFALLYGLGLRVGEVSRLRIGDVDLDRDLCSFGIASLGRVARCPSGHGWARSCARTSRVGRAIAAPTPRPRSSRGTAASRCTPIRFAIRFTTT
jgi:site-specific recombinase XerC